jgi:hypothetical protein
MKKLYYLFLIPLILIGCQGNEGALHKPSNISNIQAKSDIGGVTIFWNIPPDSNYVYVKVWTKKYPNNPDSSQILSSKASIYADSALVKGLLNKYKYTFHLQTFNASPEHKSGKGGKVLTTNPIRPIRRPIKTNYFPSSLTKINVDSSNISAATIFNQSQDAAQLLDGDMTTFWSSDWSGQPHQAPFYIRFDFNHKVSVGAFKYVERQFDGRGVTQWGFDISKDGKKWTQVWKSKPNLPTEPLSSQWELHFSKNYTSKHFRVVILANKGNNSYMALAELSLYKMKSKVVDLEKVAEQNY